MPGVEWAPDDALAEDAAVMREAALEAGALALTLAKRGDVDVWEKGKGDPVTEADLAVNALLARTLAAAAPAYGWLSEETADTAENRAADRLWVVDPIDGTKAFIRGGADWCIGIALVDGGDAVAGVVYAPVTDQLFEARRGGGAYLNGDRLAVSRCDGLDGCGLIASEEMLGHPGWPTPWPALKLCQPKPNATLLRMAHVAAGWQDATLAMWRKFDWDVAAGAVLVEEAGGVVTTHRGDAFKFNRRIPAQQSLVASGKDLHPLLIRRTEPVRLPDPQAAP